jgi:nucleotide-binding universal stress UspA family protein
MYNTILVPLDGSKRAEAILRHVKDLAGRYGATVIFLRVVEPASIVVGPEGTYTFMALHQQALEQQKDQAESYLAAVQGKFREQGVEARTHIAYGPVVEEIINAADREGADLIAIASHGRSGLPQVFYGRECGGRRIAPCRSAPFAHPIAVTNERIQNPHPG